MCCFHSMGERLTCGSDKRSLGDDRNIGRGRPKIGKGRIALVGEGACTTTHGNRENIAATRGGGGRGIEVWVKEG